MLRRGLRNQNNADIIIRQSREQPRRNTRHADHAAALNIDQSHVVDGRNARDGVLLVVSRAIHEGTGEAGIEGIQHLQRDILGKSRLQAGWINDLSPKVRQLHCLGVGNSRNRESVGNLARVGGHHTVHVGPNLDHLGVEGRPENGSRVVRAAAAQCGGDALLRGGDEARDALQSRGFGKMLEDLTVGHSEVHVGHPEVGIGANQLPGVAKLGFKPLIFEGLGDDIGR